MTIKINKQSTYPLDYHFRGKRAEMKPLFDELITKLSKELDFEYKIGKAYIGLIRTLVFVAIRIQTEKIIFEFTSRQELKSPRFIKIKHFQRQRWAYFLDIKESKDIDKKLIGWVKESGDLG
ncbi:MAG: hypothetical protein KJ864_00065 [Candidatus Omnitrophica bacterium]|nr:hypothetical protein [Candidatus Omnitrophota bacterium]MBU1894950.1 hypothetical protein [Candidatus Omnitrophota bacterium]